MGNRTVELFEEEFRHRLKIPRNAICKRCDARYKQPLLPWIVGSKYEETQERLLFVGKPHRGAQPGTLLPSGLVAPTEPHLDWLMGCSWSYWRYTRAIAERLFGEGDPWDCVAFTNIIKCTNVAGSGESPPADRTSELMARSCIQDLGVISREIEILKPRNIVFYTYHLFRQTLCDLPFATDVLHDGDEGESRPCGKKKLAWWERSVVTPWCDNVGVLVTGHPERMKKDEYVRLIANWVRFR